MAKTRTVVRCRECGREELKWAGRCAGCGTWGSLIEERQRPSAGNSRSSMHAAAPPAAVPIREVPLDAHARAVTGVDELDRVLGGGLVPGSVVLVGGAPGAGKSTLLLQAAQSLAAGMAGPGRTVLYVSAEESSGQVRLRAERLGALDGRLLVAAETDIDAVLALVASHGPDVLILDSIQTVSSELAPGIAGSVGQVRECAAALVTAAKTRGIACVLVGHVTKDGQLAGPRTLEHLVDVVCDLSGDRHHALRLLRATKNRFGSAGEVGCFELTETGMVGVTDPGRLFVGEGCADASGVAVTMTLEGRRPLACEVQALVTSSQLANPRRVASGIDAQRLALLLAVLDRRAEVKTFDRDVYASSVGGLRLVEPAVDLALCLAVASSRRDLPVLSGLVALGEVGLAGELRLVSHAEARLSEASRLGFRMALLPAAYDGKAFGLQVFRARDVQGALAAGLNA